MISQTLPTVHCLHPNNCTADTKRWTLLVCSLCGAPAPSWDWVTIRLISSSASRQHQHWELKQKRRVFRGGGILSGVKWVRIRLGSYLLKTNSWPQNCPSQVKIILLLLPAAGVPRTPGKISTNKTKDCLVMARIIQRGITCVWPSVSLLCHTFWDMCFIFCSDFTPTLSSSQFQQYTVKFQSYYQSISLVLYYVIFTIKL